jgi:hypothetical protein
MFMPWALKTEEQLPNIVINLGVTLPAWFMWPNLSTGNWKDCYADPDKIRLLNGFLFLMKCADKCSVDCYIECLPECKLITTNTMIQVCYYRLHIPLTISNVRQFILTVCMELSGNDEKEETQPKKRRRKSNSPHVYDEPESFKMTNVTIGSDQINSWPTFLQWHTTCIGHVKTTRSRQILFDMPPEDSMFEGAVLYSDDEDDEAGPANPDDTSYNGFTEWLEHLPKNHILKLLDMEVHFRSGTQSKSQRLNEHQLDYSKYVTRDFFTFPHFCTAYELVTKVEYGAPWLEGNVDNLITAPFAHCAATLTMTPEELFRKMQAISAITGIAVPDQYRQKTLKQLREVWDEQMTEGNADLSHYSAIPMLPAAERHINPHETESMKILAVMYPAYGRFTESANMQFNCLRKARQECSISKDHARSWLTDMIDSINQLYSDSAKDQFVSAYFRICSEATSVRRMGHQNDPVLQEARRLSAIQTPGMDPGDSMLALQARLLRGSLHMTPAQASPLLYLYIATLTAIMPEIDCQQPTFCLLGGSDTGKSAIMTLLMTLILAAAVIRQDTTSKLAMTANGQLGVMCTDELKTGVDTENAHDSTNWLTSISTGWHVHERLRLGTSQGEETKNITTKSDRRRFMCTASNQKPHPNFASRMDITYVHGNQEKHDISRQELATVNDNTVPWHAAKMVFQFTWADHEQFWRVQQHIRWYICTSLFPVWHNIVASLMGKQFSPSTREVGRIQRDALGFFLNRIIAQYRRTRQVDANGKAVSFVEYAMANSVVTLKDYSQCFIQKRSIIEHDDQEDIFIRALFGSIIIDEDPVGPKLRVYQRDYYVTSLSSVVDVCSRTQELASSYGIGRDIMSRLQSGGRNGEEAQVINTRGKTAGTYAIHKSLLAYSLKKPLLTKGMAVLLNFIREIIERPVTQAHPKLWYVGMNETELIFKSIVRKKILEPHSVQLESEVLHAAKLQETDVLRSYLLLQAANIMQFDDKSEPHPYTLHGTATLLSDLPTAGSTLVDRGGPLDEMRAFGAVYLEETTDSEISAKYVSDNSVRINASVQPARRQQKSPLRLPDVLIFKTEIFRDVLDKLLYTKLNSDPPAGSTSADAANAMKLMLDAVAAVEGSPVGATWFTGSSTKADCVYSTHVVRPYPKTSITIKNPYRNTVSAHFSAHNNLNDFVCPAEVQQITFPCRNSTLHKTLVEKVAEINMVEYAILPVG